jgi:hypothetical protein
VQATQAGKLIKEIPLEVTLLPHYLADDNTATIWLFASGVKSYYPALSQEQADKMIKFEGHRPNFSTRRANELRESENNQ